MYHLGFLLVFFKFLFFGWHVSSALSSSSISGVIDEGGSREHAFGLVTTQRSYHLTAETDDDRRYASS